MTIAVSLADTHCYTLGESPVWCEQQQRLYFLDILQKQLLCFDPLSGDTQTRQLPYLTSAITLTTDPDRLLLVTDEGIFTYCLSSSCVEKKLADYPEQHGATRSNEGAISPQGELFFGTMTYQDPDAVGHWYRLAAGQNQAERIGEPVGIANTLCWHDGTLYFADSKEATLYQSHDEMQTRQTLIKAEHGAPDGSALCADGKLWNARWGAYELVVYDIKSATEQIIPLPALNPTSCCFGGRDLTTLYITTAALDIEQPDEWQGRLLQLPRVGKGQMANRFRLTRTSKF